MKIKMLLDDNPMHFQYGKESYTLSIELVDKLPILPIPIRFPALKAIRIHKIKANGLVSDYYIPRCFSRKRSNYFQLSKQDFLRFKPKDMVGNAYEVTFFENPSKDIQDYALEISQKSTNPLDNTFGLRCVNNKEQELTYNKQIFACEEEKFELFEQAEEFAMDYQYYVKTIALLSALIEQKPNTQIPEILPNAPLGMTIGAIESFTTASNTYFKGEDIAIITSGKPDFLENKKYSMVTVTRTKLGQEKPTAIDLYLFEESDDIAFRILYEDKPSFMSFNGSKFKISFQTNPEYPTSILAVYKNKDSILELQLEYSLDAKNGLNGLDGNTKDAISKIIAVS